MEVEVGKWIWHPAWKEGADEGSAGGFIHFRKSIIIKNRPVNPVPIHITADTKYKLYINSKLVSIGPVKGDEHLWFYDEIDIQPYLQEGPNHIGVRVLRFYYASPYATSFPRLPFGGLLIRNVDVGNVVGVSIQSDTSWESALDLTTRLRTDLKEDDFLHTYEDVQNDRQAALEWIPAKHLEFPSSHGISAPWKLSPRLIPFPRHEHPRFKALHNLRSTKSQLEWEKTLLASNDSTSAINICLPADTSHHVELEVKHHMTAFLDFRFQVPKHAGSSLRVTYSECYEETPTVVPYFRRKSQRCDTTKQLIGPEDKYVFGGAALEKLAADLKYHDNPGEERFTPFHFRTFRFIALDIEVGPRSDLIMKGIDLTTTNYPLDVLAEFSTPSESGNNTSTGQLWTTSLRTLTNCMHDCYEDCPFYEQLQYAMDIRSSALFTYLVSSDDRMARQAIIQLHNSYRPSLGLTASRAPAHKYQIVPHFSLFWICMITDHFEYFADDEFVRPFMAVCDGIFDTFSRRIDPELGLIRILISSSQQWDFVDWAEQWRPMGIPPAAERTGFQSYTNMLYAYTLKRAADLLTTIGRPSLATEYQSRAAATVAAVTAHCFNGTFFTDGLATNPDPRQDLSQHSQIWAVLCGAVSGSQARNILSQSLASPTFTPTSIAMSFYTLRALSLAGGSLYIDHFHALWEPWRRQLDLDLTTWEEDSVSHRSDCHAWGSAPLFEFLAEVAGIKPAAPGWNVVAFEPRVSLIPELDAKIPFRRGGRAGIANVKWRRDGEETKVALEIRMDGGERFSMPVKVILPEGEVKMRNGEEDICFTVSMQKVLS